MNRGRPVVSAWNDERLRWTGRGIHMTEISDQVVDLLARFSGREIDSDSLPFFEGLLHNELRICKCDDCGAWRNPPWASCPQCGSLRSTATPVSGGGRIAWATWRHRGGAVPGWTQPPYPLAVVELDEQSGLRITSVVTNCTRSEVKDGQRVRLLWLSHEGTPLPVFEPERTQ